MLLETMSEQGENPKGFLKTIFVQIKLFWLKLSHLQIGFVKPLVSTQTTSCILGKKTFNHRLPRFTGLKKIKNLCHLCHLWFFFLFGSGFARLGFI